MAKLSLSLLGSPLITAEGEPITTLTAKTQALLAYLAIESERPHRREALAGLLWGEQSDTAARNSLRQSIHQLQRALGEVLTTTAQTVHFNLIGDHALDVRRFTVLIADCDRHVHRCRAVCRACAERLGGAAELYRGELLAGLFVKDSPAFEEWLLIKREQLSRLAVAALHDLADYHARLGEFEAMEHMARRQIQIDPFREEAVRQLLRALVLSNRRNAALAHYQAFCALLTDELNAQPEVETTALVEQIEAGQLAAALPHTNLPFPLTPLIGREQEMSQLGDCLQDPGVRLLTLVGPGGIGKTRLALEAVAREAFAFADGACFVSLVEVNAPELVLFAIADTLHFSFTDAAEPKTQLVSFLRDKELLLLLDSFEHVIEAAGLVAELLQQCPGLTGLVTSRERLQVRGERQFPVPPLRLPDLEQLTRQPSAAVSEATRAASVALFVERAHAAQPGFVLDQTNVLAVAGICIRLEAIPLAIELAAARLPQLDPQLLLERLSERLTVLTNGDRDLPARQRTLRATLDWSYSLLDAEAKTLFAKLAVFSGGGTLESIQAVCAESDCLVPRLQALRDKSLLQQREPVQSEVRWAMLDTLREYAWDQLATSGELALLAKRHAQYFLKLAEQSDVELKGAQQRVWLERIEAEHNNMRAALSWALAQQESNLALQLSSALSTFWYYHGDFIEGQHWLQQALASAGHVTPDTSSAARWYTRALIGAGQLADSRADQALAQTLLTEAVQRARTAGDKPGLALGLEWLGASTNGRDQASARNFLQESLALWRELYSPSKFDLALVLHLLGMVARYEHDYASAGTYYEEALSLRRALGSKTGIACTLASLGLVALATGNLVHGEELYRESLLLASELRSQPRIIEALEGLAATAVAQGDLRKGALLYGQLGSCYKRLSYLQPIEPATYDQYIAALRQQLDEAALATEWAQGQAMSLEQAVACALNGQDVE